ncbi:MAG TPA: DapH/DapD/GlmU-related protein [Acidimicrobiales bacterium]|nr:DapH/DapD/GlmU-related protein [Acidimicrobiales bacterium]
MARTPSGTWGRFQDLVFSDLQRYRPGEASWLKVAVRCITLPGLIASVLLRAQQCLWDSGLKQPAQALRTVGVVLLGVDFVPGAKIGRGLLLAHPNGVTIGTPGLTIGDDVSFAGGVTCAARYPDERMSGQDFATIRDGAIIGAHAVLVGPVTIGRNALVGANSVVLSDVPDDAVVMGNPARRIGTREEGTYGTGAAPEKAQSSDAAGGSRSA